VQVNGMLTRRENIADLAALKIAYLAFKRAEGGSRQRGRATATPGEFTDEQRFFLAYARFWAENRRPAYARQMAFVDSHAPGRWRVNGPLSDLPEFAEAFHCHTGDPMAREPGEKVEIW
jgi:putative endopeptidase